MTFEVVLTDEAASNLSNIADWIASHSPQGASAWLDAFEDAKRRLSEMPMSCGRAPEDGYCELCGVLSVADSR
jgi:plasmid stabilization system protein ParE